MRGCLAKVKSGDALKIPAATFNTFVDSARDFLQRQQGTGGKPTQAFRQTGIVPNKTGLTVGDITDIDKKGWEYMWVRYADAEDATAKAIVKKPVAVYVEKVYEEGDFSGLGIGT